MRQVTDSDFPAVIRSGRVLVDFYSTFCQPCKALAPLLENLEEQTSDTTFLRINIDEEMIVASLNHVTQVPTLILFEDGVETKRTIGLMPAPALKEWLGV